MCHKTICNSNKSTTRVLYKNYVVLKKTSLQEADGLPAKIKHLKYNFLPFYLIIIIVFKCIISPNGVTNTNTENISQNDKVTVFLFVNILKCYPS